MSNYSTLKAAISAVIKENNNHEITGQVLQTTLLAMVDSLAGGYLFKGIATPATVVGTPDENVFYIGGGGVYSNFGATPVHVPDGCIGIFTYNGSFENHIIPTGGVFDISAYNAVGGTPATYADLTAALGTNGANIPDALRKGGMSVKFIQGSAPSSDNNYVQFRCMSDEFTADVTKWQGVDAEPTAGSKNLIESGGVALLGEAMNVLADSNIAFSTSSPIEDVLEDTILKSDGTTASFNGAKIWTLTNNLESIGNYYILHNFQAMATMFASCCLYLGAKFVKKFPLQGKQYICLPYGYTVKICGRGNVSAPVYTANPISLKDNIAESFNMVNRKCDDINSSLVYDFYKYNIATATPSENLAFKSTKDYFKVDSSGIATVETNAAGITIVYYDSNKNYLGFTAHNGGTITKNITAEYSNAAYVRFSLRNSNYSQLTDEQYNTYYVNVISGVYAALYSSEKVEAKIENITLSVPKLKSIIDVTAVNDIVLKDAVNVTDVETGKILKPNGSISNFSGFNVYTITNTNANYNIIFVRAYFGSVYADSLSVCNVYDSDGNFIYNLNIQGYRILAVPKGFMLKICSQSIVPQKSEQYYAIDTKIKDIENSITAQGKNIFAGKKILFLGTSIPAGKSSQVTIDGYTGPNKYPEMLAYLLGATVYNEAVGSSLVRASNPLTGSYKGMPFDACLKSLSQTVAEKQSILDHWQSGLDADCNIVEGGTYGWRDFLAGQGASGPEYNAEGVPLDYSTWQTAENILKWSYEKKVIAKYFDENSADFVSHVDYIFIEHAHNDLNYNGYIFRDSPSDRVGYYDLTPAEACDFTDNNTDRSHFPSAINYLLEKIFYYNARQKIFVFGHYTNNKGETGVKFSARIVKAQTNFSEFWNLPILKIWEKCGWNDNRIKTTGYWNDSNIWVNSGGQEVSKATYRVWLQDTLHPASDASGEANMHIAKIAKELL